MWAFIAGLASFLSPCVLPLLPGYLSYISGVGVNELGARTRKVAIASIAFVGGFTIFFVLQGAAAGFAGSELGSFLSYFTSTSGEGKRVLEIVAGILLTAFGAYMIGETLRQRPLGKKALLSVFYVVLSLSVLDVTVAAITSGPAIAAVHAVGSIIILAAFGAGLFPQTWIEKERRLRLLKKPASLVGVVLAGMLFSVGVGPCTGPLLGSVFMLALGTQDPAAGASLLFVYAIGMGMPFLLSGLLFTRMIGTFDMVKRHFGAVKIISGFLLIAFGILLASGGFVRITEWMQNWLPSIEV